MLFKYNFILSSSVFHMYVLNVNKNFISTLDHHIATLGVLFAVKTQKVILFTDCYNLV